MSWASTHTHVDNIQVSHRTDLHTEEGGRLFIDTAGDRITSGTVTVALGLSLAEQLYKQLGEVIPVMQAQRAAFQAGPKAVA